jgi:hypothetical protein
MAILTGGSKMFSGFGEIAAMYGVIFFLDRK